MARRRALAVLLALVATAVPVESGALANTQAYVANYDTSGLTNLVIAIARYDTQSWDQGQVNLALADTSPSPLAHFRQPFQSERWYVVRRMCQHINDSLGNG